MESEFNMYEAKLTLGLVSNSPHASGVFRNPLHKQSCQAFVPALNTLTLWDLDQGEPVCSYSNADIPSPITKIHLMDAQRDISELTHVLSLAVGYQSGEILVVKYDPQCLRFSVEHVLFGHRKALTAFCDGTDAELISGSKDTDICLWDCFEGRGLQRLKGHGNEVTGLKLMKAKKILASVSKDGLLKIWDLATLTCLQSVVGRSGEIWSVELFSNGVILAGSADSRVSVWRTGECGRVEGDSVGDVKVEKMDGVELKENSADILEGQNVRFLGYLETSARRRVFQIIACGEYVYMANSNKKVDVFKLVNEQGIRKRNKRRVKRKRKHEETAQLEDNNDHTEFTAADMFKKMATICLTKKIQNICPFYCDSNKNLPPALIVTLNDNSLSLYQLQKAEGSSNKFLFSAHLKSRISSWGHRLVPRSIDNQSQYLLTSSALRLKLWSLSENRCVRTLKLNDIITKAVFAPLNPLKTKLLKNAKNSAVVATQKGHLHIYDLFSSNLVCSARAARTAEITALYVHPETGKILTGTSEGEIGFWEAIESETATVLNEYKSFEVSEHVLCLKISSDSKYLAAGLIDSTVKVYFEDSLKFYLSLYGHKLPVYCIDISDDGRLLVSGSADKNVKIWGLDFGDCHRSIFAHDSTVTSVVFLRKSHAFFSSSKDRLIKMWDADKFEQLLVLRGHCAEVWGVCLSADGRTLASVSSDMSVRTWETTGEPLFAEEQQELELERAFEDEERKDRANESRPGFVKGSGLEDEFVTAVAGRKTKGANAVFEKLDAAINTVMAAAYEEAGEDGVVKKDIFGDTKNFEVAGRVREVVQNTFLPALSRLNANDLDSAVFSLSYFRACSLLKCLLAALAVDSAFAYDRIVRSVLVIARVHEKQLRSDDSLHSVVMSLKNTVNSLSGKWADMVGKNLASLILLRDLMKTNAESSQTNHFVDENEIIDNIKLNEKRINSN